MGVPITDSFVADDDDILFAEEAEDRGDGQTPWIVLIIDDEPDVHVMTELLLADVQYRGRPMRFLNAYSAREARAILENRDDIAVALLDVVMEDDHAGLCLAQVIREEIGNRELRIILRTGQPGLAPQREVIVDYDINDYRSKAELTADNLFITIVSALRSYEQITEIEAKVAERTAELSASHRRLEHILQSSPVGVGALQDDGVLVFANERLSSMMGVPTERLIGASAEDLFEDPEAGQQHLEAIRNRRQIRDSEVRMRRADGSAFWALIAGDPTKIAGTTTHLNWIYDIERRKRSEAELNAAKEQAEQATQAKSAFLATMSHEIRTPMNGVLGMLDMLERTPLSTDQTETVATIRESASLLLRIIDDILDFSKIEAGRLALECVPLSLEATVESVARTLLPTAQRKGLEFATFVDPSLPRVVMGDPVRLRQILFNLAGNAIKFTETGSVVIRADRVAAGDGAARPLVRFRVVDTGIGISEEGQASLFQAYSQVERSTTRHYGGTGLGLSICRRLTAMMGGDIGVASAVGQGSSFWVVLPLEHCRDGTSETEAATLSGLRVAVGIDYVNTADYVVAYLHASGAETVSATTGLALRDQITQVRAAGGGIDVAVFDEAFYRCSAGVLQDALRDDGTGQPVPIVLLTDRAEQHEKSTRSLTVARPVRRSALLRAVAVATARQAAPARVIPAPRPITSVPVAGCDGEMPLVLVAEDNATNRKVIGMQLTMLGYAADMAGNGREALERLDDRPYEALLTDCNMPEMDGFELAKVIRDREGGSAHRRLPIIAITANAFEGEAERFQAAGMDDYLTKPLDINKLGALLAHWLPTPAAQTAMASVDGKSAASDAPTAEATGGASDETPRPNAGGPQAVDLRSMSQLCGDDSDLVREMLLDFVSVSREVLRSLETALALEDAAGVKAGAHNLKGSSRTAGANPLADACRQLELAAQAADWPVINACAAEVSRQFDLVVDHVGDL